jgi:hypothetical protein
MSTMSIENMATRMIELESKMNDFEAKLEGVMMASAKAPSSTPKKTKKAPADPNAPKKPNNVWIIFTTRVTQLLKSASAEGGVISEKFKGPATMVKSFCSGLKQQKTYDEWNDSEILEAFEAWTPTTDSSTAKVSLISKLEDVAVPVVAKKQRKSKKVDAAAAEPSAELVAEAPVVSAPKKQRKSKAAAAEPAAEPSAEPAKKAPRKVKAKGKVDAEAPTIYTMEQLIDFDIVTINDIEYGLNKRGDVMDYEKVYIGSYNKADNTINTSSAKPADWDDILKGLE